MLEKQAKADIKKMEDESNKRMAEKEAMIKAEE